MIDLDSFKGIIVPVVTPIDADEHVDIKSVSKITNYLINGGVSAIFVLGTTGEFAFFDRRQKIEILESFLKTIEGKIPLFVNISEEGTKKTLDFYKDIKDFPIDAVVSIPPYYFRITTDDELYGHFSTIAERVEIPLVLYNMPTLSGNKISPIVVRKCAAHKNIVGMKDSSSDINYFTQVLHETREEEFLLYQGDEQLLLASLIIGAHGGVNTLANIAPKIGTGIYQSWIEKDIEKAIFLQKKYNELHAIYSIGNSVFSALKTALHLQGLCSIYCCAPLKQLVAVDVEKIRVLLQRIELIP